MASATASARVAAFSLSNTAAKWNFTVLAETERARAMPLLDVPLATRPRIWRSREVRGRPLRGACVRTSADGPDGFGPRDGVGPCDGVGPDTAEVEGDAPNRSRLADSSRARALGSNTIRPASTAAR